ncbi:MAG: DUF58 domain-containing protein [Clostridia bacterium]|nr:DUF58 domain-containing protein [Clostridia bacterium]
MPFIVLVIVAIAIFALRATQFRKRALNNTVYKVRTEAREVSEGDDFFLYETIANAKNIPLPNVRVDVTLPTGLDFCLYDKEGERHKTAHMHNIESVFVLKPGSAVERRWRIRASRRGIYHLGEARMVVSDIFGTTKLSAFFEAPREKENTVTVLPSPIDLEEYFIPVTDPMGDNTTDFSLIPDPLLYLGTREYRPGDPVSRINQKASARMQKQMVDIDEYTERNSFDLVFNLQSRGREDTGTTPESAELVELGISVCASVFDRALSEEIPVRMICNTTHENDERDYFISEYFSGRSDIKEALRMLAGVEMKLSCRIEDMLEELLIENESNPTCKNLVLVTSYIDEVITDFALKMKALGIEVIIFATSTLKSVPDLPAGIRVFYKTYR